MRPLPRLRRWTLPNRSKKCFCPSPKVAAGRQSRLTRRRNCTSSFSSSKSSTRTRPSFQPPSLTSSGTSTSLIPESMTGKPRTSSARSSTTIPTSGLGIVKMQRNCSHRSKGRANCSKRSSALTLKSQVLCARGRMRRTVPLARQRPSVRGHAATPVQVAHNTTHLRGRSPTPFQAYITINNMDILDIIIKIFNFLFPPYIELNSLGILRLLGSIGFCFLISVVIVSIVSFAWLWKLTDGFRDDKI